MILVIVMMNFEVHIDELRIDVMNMYKIIIIIEVLLFEAIDVLKTVVDMKQGMNGQKIMI
jgi:hypothetical protein